MDISSLVADLFLLTFHGHRKQIINGGTNSGAKRRKKFFGAHRRSLVLAFGGLWRAR